jgi:hypothetical protein
MNAAHGVNRPIKMRAPPMVSIIPANQNREPTGTRAPPSRNGFTIPPWRSSQVAAAERRN